MAVAISRTADPAGAGTGTTITYSAASIGTAEDDRIVVVCVGTELTSGTPSSATLNYGAGAIAMNATSLASFGVMGARIFWLPAPTGTTADIAVTFGASQAATTQHLCVYRVVGAAVESSGVNTSTDMDSTAPLTTGSLTIRGSGGFIGIAVGATDAVGKTWANATEDLDEDAGSFQFTTATRATALAATAVTCTGGTNAEDGALAWLLLRPGIIAGAGSYALTGTAATVKHGWRPAADVGSYALTGTAAAARKGYMVAAGAGAYAVTGTAASVLHKDVLAAGAGSYVITGTAASVLHSWKAAAGAGSYSITGSDVTLTKGAAPAKSLAAEAGSYILSGSAASVLRGLKVAAAAGSYSLSGTNAALLHASKIAAAAGSYSLNGSAATPVNSHHVSAGAGSYALTGASAGLLHKWKAAAGTGSYSLTGSSVSLTLRSDKFLSAAAGGYALTGTAAALRQAHKIAADVSASYALTGTSSALNKGQRLAAGAGSYALNGNAASFASAKVIAALTGNYALTGSSASVVSERWLAMGTGAYALTGSDAAFLIALAIPPDTPEAVHDGEPQPPGARNMVVAGHLGRHRASNRQSDYSQQTGKATFEHGFLGRRQ